MPGAGAGAVSSSEEARNALNPAPKLVSTEGRKAAAITRVLEVMDGIVVFIIVEFNLIRCFETDDCDLKQH